MEHNTGPIEWRGVWSPDHPVAAAPDGSLVLYLSVEDAVRRIFSGSVEMVLASPDRQESFRIWIRSQLESGQSLSGYRLMKEKG